MSGENGDRIQEMDIKKRNGKELNSIKYPQSLGSHTHKLESVLWVTLINWNHSNVKCYNY